MYFFGGMAITGSSSAPIAPPSWAPRGAPLLCDGLCPHRFYLGTHAQKGLADTLGDMLVGILGGVVLLAFVLLRKTPPPAGMSARGSPGGGTAKGWDQKAVTRSA